MATTVADKGTLGTISRGASLLLGGSSDFTPESVSAEIQATVAAGAVYVYDGKTADGGEVVSLAATVGHNLAFRTDVASHFAKGTNFLHRKIGGKFQTACQGLGHECVHLVQHRSGRKDPRENEPVAEPIAWRCR